MSRFIVRGEKAREQKEETALGLYLKPWFKHILNGSCRPHPSPLFLKKIYLKWDLHKGNKWRKMSNGLRVRVIKETWNLQLCKELRGGCVSMKRLKRNNYLIIPTLWKSECIIKRFKAKAGKYFVTAIGSIGNWNIQKFQIKRWDQFNRGEIHECQTNHMKSPALGGPNPQGIGEE